MYKLAGFFSGVGGIELGFKEAGFLPVFANEFDLQAASTYNLNFNEKATVVDIHSLDPKDIPIVDVVVAGFPCQAFSVAGYRKGFDDDRGNLFFEVIRLIEAQRPSVLFFENVKNLVGHDKGNTYKVILETLTELGYHVKDKVLNSSEYGNIPQNRERIYIVAFRDIEVYKNFEFPKPVPLTMKIGDIVSYDTKVEDKYYYTQEKNKFYGDLSENIRNRNTIYQWRRKYVRENKSNVCPTLTANMGTGGHNVPLVLTKHGIRKLTPNECFSFQGYPLDYQLPNIANCHLYKQAGNSVVVPVVKAIAQNILIAMGNKK